MDPPLSSKRQKVDSSPDPHLTTTSTISPPHSHHQHHYVAASLPPSHYPGLSAKQIKRLEKDFKKTDTKIEFAKGLLSMIGHIVSKEETTALVARYTDETPEARTYSDLTSQDFEKL